MYYAFIQLLQISGENVAYILYNTMSRRYVHPATATMVYWNRWQT